MEIIEIMSALQIISLGASNTPASVSPCQNYVHSFEVRWDTAVAPISYPLTVLIYPFTTQQVTRQINSSDQTGTDGTELIFEVDFEVPRWESGLASALVFNPTSTQLAEVDYNALSSWNILNVSATTDINGVGTVTVSTVSSVNSAPLGIEISINNVDYFPTNVLTGLSSGNYTLYVRDAYGCSRTEGFEVNDSPAFEVYNDFKFVSLLNPVPFTAINKNRPSFANTPSYAVDGNPLSKHRKYEFVNPLLAPTQTRVLVINGLTLTLGNNTVLTI